MSQRKDTIASAFSHLGFSRPSTAQSTDTSLSTTSSSSRNPPFYHSSSSSSATTSNLHQSNMGQSTLHPRGQASLEHKTSSTSIRSLLNNPVLDPRLHTIDRPSSEDRSRATPTRDERPYSSAETPRPGSGLHCIPSPGSYRSTAQSARYGEQVRKVSEGGSEGEASSGSGGLKRPRSSVSDGSSRFDYPFPTPAYTASISQQAYQPTPMEPDMYSTMPSKAIQTNGSSRAPISRATKACNACRSRKVRCDAGGPKSSTAGEELPCTRCKDSGIQCVYTGSQRKRGPAPGANRPGQRRKPSSLELEMGATMGLAAPHDMSRTRSTSSIGSGNGHYHPYAPPGNLPSPPSAYRLPSRSGNGFPPYHPNERYDYGRPPLSPFDRSFNGPPRPPMTAPPTAYPHYRHSIPAEGQYPPPPMNAPVYGYPHESLSRHPPPPGAHPDYLRPRLSYPDIDPSLQAEPRRPSTALSGWQGGEGPPPAARAPSAQEPNPPRPNEAAAYQAGYEAALREARIAAKVEAQNAEQDRRDRERERERMMHMEREGRTTGGPGPPPRGFENPGRPPYWERPHSREAGREKIDERISDRERERLQRRDAEMAAAAREHHHHHPEIDTRVTLPPIHQMDRPLAL